MCFLLDELFGVCYNEKGENMTKEKIIEIVKTFVYAVLAGICISVGGAVYLACENIIVGAIFFAVGLFTIFNFNLNLYTGKLCYVFNNNWRYSLKLVLILVGNFIGTSISAGLLRLTRFASKMAKCQAIVDVKIADKLSSLFILAIFCGFLIYVASECFKSENALTKYLGLFFGVSVFVICGFEHSVADMFYFAFVGNFTGRAFLSLLVVALGNFVGGTAFELIKKLFKPKEKQIKFDF